MTSGAAGVLARLLDLWIVATSVVVPAHAKFVKAIAYAKVKTDAVDALTLAQLLREFRLHNIDPWAATIAELSMGFRRRLVDPR